MIAADLWRGRLAVCATALIALVVAVALTYRVELLPPSLETRQRGVGVGSALALVDTSRSQVVDAGGGGGTELAKLSDRASLLASLMLTAPLKDEIARNAGLDPQRLITTRPLTLADRRRRIPEVPTASISPSDPRAHILHVTVTPLVEGTSPIIAVDTQAPTATGAARLANQSIASLKAHLDRVAAVDRVPEARRLVVTQFEPAESSTAQIGPSRILAISAAVLVLGSGLAAVALIAHLRRHRAASDRRAAPRPAKTRLLRRRWS